MSDETTMVTRRGRRGDRGAALIEFAIIAPLVFMLLLGLFSGGILLNQRNSMTNAVREGARMGATLPASGTWGNTVEGRVLDLAAGDLKASQVCVQLLQAPSTTPVQNDSTCSGALAADQPSLAGVPAGDCVAVVWSSKTGKLEAVVFSRNITMETHSISKYEQDCS
jgi:Flp pilus assembly protein TadG